MKFKLILLLCLISGLLKAQQPPIQFFRSYDKNGLRLFETTKADTTLFTGMKVRIGGNFTQDFQALSHQNNATPVLVNGVNTNKLIAITNGFNRAMANLNIDVQLEDGIRMNLTMYLSSRHHEETWVKGGFVQIDKLVFLKSDFVNALMKSFTIKIGDYELDYGDQHYRRSDGGNAIYNPFVENYIMDEFATEVGAEIYFHPRGGFIAMGGITNGELNPTVVSSTQINVVTGKLNRYAPAFHGKLGYDKQISPDLRFRLTGSFYAVKSAASNTIFFGDRTGSRYFLVMENTAANPVDNAWSGRYNPQFGEQVTTFMINPFVKFRGLEFFGTYERARGRVITEPDMRTATQYAVDLIYRFPENSEKFWIAGRYNSVKAAMPSTPNDITINRGAGTVGWFVTKNMALKVEYVNQQYKNFATTDIHSGGKFDGFMIEASVGF